MTPYPVTPLQELLAAVEAAVRLGQGYQLTTRKQIKTLAKCYLEFGEAFPAHYPEASKILANPRMASWRKHDSLEAWLPRGRVRRALLAPYGDDGTLDNFRPIADKETP